MARDTDPTAKAAAHLLESVASLISKCTPENQPTKELVELYALLSKQATPVPAVDRLLALEEKVKFIMDYLETRGVKHRMI